MHRLRDWINRLRGVVPTLTDDEAQAAVRLPRSLTMVGDVYPAGSGLERDT